MGKLPAVIMIMMSAVVIPLALSVVALYDFQTIVERRLGAPRRPLKEILAVNAAGISVLALFGAALAMLAAM